MRATGADAGEGRASFPRGDLSFVPFWQIPYNPQLCTHPSAKVDFNTKASGKKEARLIMAWHALPFDPQGAFLRTCSRGGLLTSRTRNMWSGQGPAPSL